MSLADDQLDLAKKMVNYTKSDLLDARLRRAISTAYYALFHLLLEHGAARIVSHVSVQHLVTRAYSHGDMLKAAKSFQSGAQNLPAHLTAPFGGNMPSFPSQLSAVAKAFVLLQAARHEADYDLAKAFTRGAAQRLVDKAEQAFTDWKAVIALPQHADMCQLFLAALLLGERWRK